MKVGPITYTVNYVPKDHPGLEGNDGFCNVETCNIYVREDLTEEAKAEVVLHETLHACFEVSGITYLLEKRKVDDELIVRMLSPILLGALGGV